MRLHINGRLYVGDIAPDTGDADLRRHFGRYGKIADICIPMDRLTGRPRCFAFVQFSCPEDAGRALADAVHHVINGREVYIARAQPGQLERSMSTQYKPLCQRICRANKWCNYRVGDIAKFSIGSLIGYGIVTYISEDGEIYWSRQLAVQSDSKSAGFGQGNINTSSFKDHNQFSSSGESSANFCQYCRGLLIPGATTAHSCYSHGGGFVGHTPNAEFTYPTYST